MSGGEAVAFLRRSGLSQQALASVWTFADEDEVGFLTPRQFYAALRLIGLAQSLKGVALTAPMARPVIAESVEAPAPTLEGVEVPPLRSETEWALRAEQMEQYSALFASLDDDGDGRVSGAEMVPIMTRWGLPQTVNRQVWDLADGDADGYLDEHGVCVALCLLEGAKRGRELPASLPASLADPGAAAAAVAGAPQGGAAPRPPRPSGGFAFGQEAARDAAFDPHSRKEPTTTLSGDGVGFGAPSSSPPPATFVADFGGGEAPKQQQQQEQEQEQEQERQARAPAPADAFTDAPTTDLAPQNDAPPPSSAAAVAAGDAGVAAAERELEALRADAKGAAAAAANGGGGAEAVGARIRALAAQLDELHNMLGLGRLAQVPRPQHPLFDSPAFSLKLSAAGAGAAPSAGARPPAAAPPAAGAELGAAPPNPSPPPGVDVDAFASLSLGDSFGRLGAAPPTSAGAPWSSGASSGDGGEQPPPSNASSADAPPTSSGPASFGAGRPLAVSSSFGDPGAPLDDDAFGAIDAPPPPAPAGGGAQQQAAASDAFSAFDDAFGSAQADKTGDVVAF